MRGPAYLSSQIYSGWPRAHARKDGGSYQHTPALKRIFRSMRLLLSYEHRSRLAARGAS